MKVEIINYQEDEYCYEEGYAVKINGKIKFDFWNGYDCPEDNNMRRNFSDVKSIPEVMKMAFDFGKEHPDEQIEIVTYITDSRDAFDALFYGYEVPEDVADSVQTKTF